MFIGFLLIFVFLLIFATMIYAGFSGAPYLPTSKKKIKAALMLAQVKEGEVIGDLGSGTGRFLFLAAKETAAKEIIGWEISLLPYLISMIKKLFSGRRSRIKIIYSSFFKADFSQLNVVYCFGLPRVMKKLEPKFRQELKPGSRLVSYTFSLPSLKPVKTLKLTKNSPPLLLYQF